MNKQEFLQKFTGYKLTYPVELILKTVKQGGFYLPLENYLFLEKINPEITLNYSQEIALNFCFTNNPITVIQGVYGSGKTTLAKILAEGIIKEKKSLLLLSFHQETLSSYENLPLYQLNDQETYHYWWVRQLREKYLTKLEMTFLPLHLLEDTFLNQLRKRRKLEKILPILQNNQDEELKLVLENEFPDLENGRLNLLEYKLKQLLPLLEKNLWLIQKIEEISDEDIINLAEDIMRETSHHFMTTINYFLQSKDLDNIHFDCVIIEESEYLSWEELLKIATMTNKLILFGNLPLNLQQNNRKKISSESPFFWLEENLFPNYCYQIKNQFRLHFSLSRPIFTTLYNQWIHTEINPESLMINNRLQWIDVRGKPNQGVNILEGKRLLNFLFKLSNFSLDDIGILTFNNTQKTWLQNNILPQFKDVFIGSFEDWIGKEKKIILISLVGEIMDDAKIAIALTRVKDYLILFGDYQLWLQKSNYLRDLILSENMEREREVTLV